MKKLFFAAACSAMLFAGCKNVELAQREITPEEKAWRAYVQECYPGWKPNETLPPAVESVDSADPAGFPADDAAMLAAPASASSAQTAAGADQEYTIVKGDTLGKISMKFYGTSRRYQKIYEANRNVLKSQDKLIPGTKIRIPAK